MLSEELTAKGTIERYLNRPEWLQVRHNTGLGASDGASVVGLSGWQSAYGLWVALTEPLVVEPMDELAEWGLLLEPVILEQFAARAKMECCRFAPFSLCRDNERPHLFASLDAVNDSGEPVQLKTAHFGAARVWAKEVPLAYMCQCQHEIHVTGAKCGYIAVLMEGRAFRWHKVPRHQRFIDRLLKRLDHFWFDFVQKRMPPPTDYHRATTQALLKKYPTATRQVIELPDDLEPLYDEFEKVSGESKAAAKRKDEITNQVRHLIGGATYGRFLSGKGWKWAGENGKRRLTKCANCPDPS